MPGPLDAYRNAPSNPATNLTPAVDGSEPATPNRPWIGVQFLCAAKYVRVFRKADGSGYLARCPTCGKTMWFRVGAGGTGERFFEVTCR